MHSIHAQVTIFGTRVTQFAALLPIPEGQFTLAIA